MPNDQMLAAGTASDKPKNQATGQTATVADSITDFQKVYDYASEKFGTYQLWGRTPKFEIVTASGTDETAQRADALEVINKKPFMVVDLTATGTGGAPVFASTVAARKILVGERGDDREDRRPAEPVPLELRRRQRRRYAAHRRVRGQVVGRREGAVGRRQGPGVADAEVRGGVPDDRLRPRRVRASPEAEWRPHRHAGGRATTRATPRWPTRRRRS